MRTFVAVLFAASFVSAQQPTLSGAAVSPLTCTVATPTATSTQSVPVGPLGSIGTVAAGLGATTLTGDLQWQLWNANAELGFFAQQSSHVWPTAPSGSTVTADYDVRLSITASAPTVVDLDVSLLVTGSPGVPLPNVQVDVGDDGLSEFTQASPTPLHALVAMSTTPQPIRVRLQSQLAVQGRLDIELRVIVRPAYVAIDPAIGSCVLGANRLAVQPTFDGIAVRSLHAHLGAPVALVFGLLPQPLLVPSPLTLPCLLLPRADFVAVVWDQTPYSLAIPTAVWPVVLWTQGVELPFGGWVTTEGYRVTAG